MVPGLSGYMPAYPEQKYSLRWLLHLRHAALRLNVPPRWHHDMSAWRLHMHPMMMRRDLVRPPSCTQLRNLPKKFGPFGSRV